MKSPAYVIHDERRWRVTDSEFEDGRELYNLELRIPGGKTIRLAAWADDCQPWERPQGHRVIVGKKLHRGSRVRLDSQQDDRGETQIKLRLIGRRKSYTTTLEGLFDLAARAEAQKIALDRAFKRRTKRR